MKKFVLLVVLLLGLNGYSQVINVSTGIDTAGNALPGGSIDPNWQITSSPNPPGTPAKVQNYYFGYWQSTPVATTNAGWIDTSSTLSDLAGIYTFERSFTVASGASSLTCNFAATADDVLVSLELVRPDLTTISLPFVPTLPYQLSLPVSNVISSPMAGVWKIRAVVNFVDSVGAFLTSGNVTIVAPISVCLPATQDSLIHEFVPTTNYGSNSEILASRWTYSVSGGNGFYTTKTLHQFDLTSIPPGAVITAAVMKLKVCTTCSTAYSTHKDLSGSLGNAGIVEQVATPWAENTVTWATAPTILSGSVAIPSLGNGSTADVLANVTTMVQNMVSTGVNNGFQLSLANNSSYYHSLVYGTRENSNPAFQPELCVTYTLPTTPGASVLTPVFCGSTLSTIDQLVYFTPTASATNYKVRATATSPTTMGVGVWTSGSSITAFKLTYPGFLSSSVHAYATTYQIEVAAKVGGVWLPYGAPCSISTPSVSTQLVPSICGASLTTIGQNITANTVPYLTFSGNRYVFRVYNTATATYLPLLYKVLPVFKMTDFATYDFGTTYNVEVAVINNDGNTLAFGPMCTIRTPAFPTTQIQTSQCGSTPALGSTLVYATPISTASPSQWRFRLINTSLSYNTVITRSFNSFWLNLFPAIATSTTYTIEVAMKIGGTWGPYGSICNITTPGTLPFTSPTNVPENASSKEVSTFNVVAYPNPFQDNFKLELQSNIDDKILIKGYDMMGVKVLDVETTYDNLQRLSFGESYKTGFYLITITQGINQKTIRVYKK